MSSAQSPSLNLHVVTQNKNGRLDEAFPWGFGLLGTQGAEALAKRLDAGPSPGGSAGGSGASSPDGLGT